MVDRDYWICLSGISMDFVSDLHGFATPVVAISVGAGHELAFCQNRLVLGNSRFQSPFVGSGTSRSLADTVGKAAATRESVISNLKSGILDLRYKTCRIPWGGDMDSCEIGGDRSGHRGTGLARALLPDPFRRRSIYSLFS